MSKKHCKFTAAAAAQILAQEESLVLRRLLEEHLPGALRTHLPAALQSVNIPPAMIEPYIPGVIKALVPLIGMSLAQTMGPLAAQTIVQRLYAAELALFGAETAPLVQHIKSILPGGLAGSVGRTVNANTEAVPPPPVPVVNGDDVAAGFDGGDF